MVIGRFTSHWIKLRKTYIARYADKVFPSLHEYFPVSEKGVIQSVTQISRKKNPSTLYRSGTYDLLVTSPDTLPLSYRRLVGAKDPTLGSCILLGLESQCVLTRNDLNVMANFKSW